MTEVSLYPIVFRWHQTITTIIPKKRRIFVCLAMERGIKFIIMSFVDFIFFLFFFWLVAFVECQPI